MRDCADCGHDEDSHQPEFGCWEPDCECLDFDDADETWVDIGGGMVVPLAELTDEAT